mmetsp:Transcript_135171/g.320415  ORF Transcript_135171/g.320415 Transcript_135171/m.320415 type:complete len:259 (-) Transcript_135171:371-1147(-)
MRGISSAGIAAHVREVEHAVGILFRFFGEDVPEHLGLLLVLSVKFPNARSLALMFTSLHDFREGREMCHPPSLEKENHHGHDGRNEVVKAPQHQDDDLLSVREVPLAIAVDDMHDGRPEEKGGHREQDNKQSNGHRLVLPCEDVRYRGDHRQQAVADALKRRVDLHHGGGHGQVGGPLGKVRDAFAPLSELALVYHLHMLLGIQQRGLELHGYVFRRGQLENRAALTAIYPHEVVALEGRNIVFSDHKRCSHECEAQL